MKLKNIMSVAALLLASLSAVQAQTTIAAWTFENDPIATTLNPAPSTDNSVGAVSASSIGMNVYPTGSPGVNAPDVLVGKNSDTGANGIADTTQIWRIRATGAANGWSSLAPVGTQGAQFNVDTTGYGFTGGISISFDWYLTTQGEANIQLQYTTDGVNWSNVVINISSSESAAGIVVVDNSSGSDANSVTGLYVSDNLLNYGSPAGQDWFTNLTATITDPNAAGNPNFAIRLVNASTGASCVSSQGTALNNTSGNWRFDNIIISGTPGGSGASTPPTVSPSLNATVDGPFTNTFTDTLNWHTAITSIKVDGTPLTGGYRISSTNIVFTPSLSVPAHLLQTSGLLSIQILANGYTPALVNQYVAPGAVKQLSVSTQPAAPTGNGGTLVVQPVVTVLDQYGNVSTNCAATYTASPNAGWSFGTGSGLAQVLTNGTATFTNLSAFSGAAIPNAVITFTPSASTGLGSLSATPANSAAFSIPAPGTKFTSGDLAVYQVDVSANNSTFSILELSPFGFQSSPVNTFPITATGTNAMRTSNSGSTGRLSTSADGSLVCFDGFLDGSSTTSDETDILPRGAGTLDPLGNYVLQASYIGNDSDPVFGNTQARSATTLDNVTFYMGDKFGVYTNDNNVVVSGSGGNVRPLKCFNGKVYALTQSGNSQATVLLMNYVNGNSLYPLYGFPVETLASDFYMIASGQHGLTNDVLYYIDPTNTTSGAIFKFCLSYDPANNDGNGQQGWVPAGQTTLIPPNGSAPLNSAPTPNGGDGLFAETNAAGGVDLYYTTGTGSLVNNSLVKVTDSGTYGVGINLGAFQTLYTTGPNSILKGVTIAPVAHTLTSTLGGGKFVVHFTAATGMSFSVLSTNNLTAPKATWPVIGTATEIQDNPGHYQFTDLNPATNSTRFYIMRQP